LAFNLAEARLVVRGEHAFLKGGGRSPVVANRLKVTLVA
jgi:hypothetical protein